MKVDLKETLKALELPAGLLALFAAVLGIFGVELVTVLLIVEGLVGTFALIALLINVLKWAGVISDGSAGKWSAIANLVVVVAVALVFKLYPTLDFTALDTNVADFVNVAGVVFAYIVQLVGSKGVHVALTNGIGIQAFSHSLGDA